MRFIIYQKLKLTTRELLMSLNAFIDKKYLVLQKIKKRILKSLEQLLLKYIRSKPIRIALLHQDTCNKISKQQKNQFSILTDTQILCQT